MSEGGQLPWKRQSIDTHRGPSTDYSSIQSPLPKPPKGHSWVLNSETNEWSVVPIQAASIVPTNTTKTKTDDGGTIVNAVVVSGPARFIKSSNFNDKGKECDYITHIVQSTDTMQGLCLKYKVSATKLRQLNKFSGSNLALAPHTLIIPSSNNNSNIQSITPDPKEQSIHCFVQAIRSHISDLRRRTGRTNVSTLSRIEAIAYLDMNDWNVDKAVQDAKEDIGWEVANKG